MINEKLKFVLRFLVTSLLIILLLWIINWRDSLTTISNISLPYVALLLVISFLMIATSCFKWQIFLRARNLNVSLTRLILLYLVGYFFNNFLPSNVGGDVARSFILGKEIQNNPDSFGSVFLERFTGLLGLLVLAIFAFFLNIRVINKPEIGIFLLFFLIAFIATALLLFTKWSQKLLAAVLDLSLLKAIKNKAVEFLKVIYYFRNQRVVLSKAMLISFLFHIMTVINTLVVCLSLGIDVAVFDLAVVVPIILIVSAIPISLNGIGLWEGSFVYFFSVVGITPSAALSIALVLRAKNLFIALIGGVVFGLLNKLPEGQLKYTVNESD